MSDTACTAARGAHHAWPLVMATAGTKDSLERDCEAMTLQQPPPALKGGCPPALYIHSMPAWVLEDFCQKMDCLSDYDWMRFGEGRQRGGSGVRRCGGRTRLGQAVRLPPRRASGRVAPQRWASAGPGQGIPAHRFVFGIKQNL